jgi:hypothetical protein
MYTKRVTSSYNPERSWFEICRLIPFWLWYQKMQSTIVKLTNRRKEKSENAIFEKLVQAQMISNCHSPAPYQPQSDLEPFFAEILIRNLTYSCSVSKCRTDVFSGSRRNRVCSACALLPCLVMVTSGYPIWFTHVLSTWPMSSFLLPFRSPYLAIIWRTIASFIYDTYCAGDHLLMLKPMRWFLGQFFLPHSLFVNPSLEYCW